MDTKFYTSTNWAPWLGGAFLITTLIFGFVSNPWVLAILVILCFLPALVVSLTLKGYFVVDNLSVKYCYDRKNGVKTNFTIPLNDISKVKRIGKSVVIYYNRGESYSSRVHQSEDFVNTLTRLNPHIKVV